MVVFAEMNEFVSLVGLIRARDAAMATVQDMGEGPLKIATYETVLAELVKYSLRLGIQSSGGRATTSALKRVGTTDRILGLEDEGYFAKPRSLTDIRDHLAAKGFHYRLEDLGTPLTRLVQRKRLRRSQTSERGKRKWMYSNY